VDKDNENRVLVKKEWLRQAEETLVEEDDLREKIREAQGKDKQVVKAVEELKRLGIKSIKDEEWSIEDGLVLKEERIYVPERALRMEVIRRHHDTTVGGHGGRWKTTELVERNYWWPGMTKEVAKYVEGCDLCCGSGRQKTLCVTLTYVEITSSGVNCVLKNSRGGKSRSGKVIKKGI